MYKACRWLPAECSNSKILYIKKEKSRSNAGFFCFDDRHTLLLPCCNERKQPSCWRGTKQSVEMIANNE